MSANPGLSNQSSARRTFRLLGLLLLVTGVALVIYGFGGFAMQVVAPMDSVDSVDSMGGPENIGRYFAAFAVGGLLSTIGLVLAGLGFQGVMARYGAGETMPVVKDSVDYLTDGQGLMGVGRSVDDAAAPAAAGEFCRKCGDPQEVGARFCNACGAAVV